MPRARKGWAALKPEYRKRLERSGVTKSEYESGASLAKARGHEKTPEHPTRTKAKVQKYPQYYQERDRLIKAVQDRKERLWHTKIKYDDRRQRDNVRKGIETNAQLRWALKATEDELIDAIRQDIIESDLENFRWLAYH